MCIPRLVVHRPLLQESLGQDLTHYPVYTRSRALGSKSKECIQPSNLVDIVDKDQIDGEHTTAL